MIAIETLAEVAADRTARIDFPKSIPPGIHRVVLVIDENPMAPSEPGAPLALQKIPLAGWPCASSFRREEIYGDDGR